MSLYRRGKTWWFHFHWEGQHIQRSTKVTSKKLAARMEAALKTQLALGKYDMASKKQNPTFAEYAQTYLDYSKSSKPSYSVERYYIPEALVPFFGRYRLSEITPLLVERYKQKRLADGLKKSSINREVGLLKSMLGMAVRWQLVDRNNARDAKLFRLDEPPPSRVLSREEEERLLQACDTPLLRAQAPHLGPIVLVALYTGLRRGEILRLRWADVDLSAGLLSVRKSKSKAGVRHVNLNSVVRDKLAALRTETSTEWVFPSPKKHTEPLQDVKNAFRRALRMAGVNCLTFHALRHTFCTRLVEAGVVLPVVQELAGHASILMTRRYTHPASELKQAAVELLVAGQKTEPPATKVATSAKSEGGRRSQRRPQVIRFKQVVADVG